MMPGVFITSTGTGTGKTYVGRGLARALARRSIPVAALKPLETGVTDAPADALALARAANRLSLAHAPEFFRAQAPLAPYAAALEAGIECPTPEALAQAVRRLANPGDFLLVEGAGGLLVPIGPRATIADLAKALKLPLVVVAHDALGVLSHALSVLEAAGHRALPVAALILSAHGQSAGDPSPRTNARILGERLDLPVLQLGPTGDDDDALADVVERCGLLDHLGLLPLSPPA